MLTINSAKLTPIVENIHSRETQNNLPEQAVAKIYQEQQPLMTHPGVTVYDIGFKGIWKLMTNNEGESSKTWIGRLADWLCGVKETKQKSEDSAKQKREISTSQVKENSVEEDDSYSSERENAYADNRGKFCQAYQYFSQDYPENKVSYNILCIGRYLTENKLTSEDDKLLQSVSCECLNKLCLADEDLALIMNAEGVQTNVTKFSQQGYNQLPFEISYISLAGTFTDFALDNFKIDQKISSIKYCESQEEKTNIKLSVVFGGVLTVITVIGISPFVMYRCKKKQQALDHASNAV